MAFNGTGTFVRLYNWVTDKTNSVPITASRMDAEQDGIAAGLSNCITKDGQTTITQNIPFNSKKITGLANGSVLTDSINVGQVQDGQFTYFGATGGDADNYTLTPSPTLTATNLGFFIFQASATCNAGADMDISARGAEDLHKSDGAGSTTAIEAGDIISGSRYYAYDNGTNVIVLNPEKPYLNSTNFVNNNFNPNILINGQGLVAQRGTTFTSTSVPLNSDDTYLLDRMLLLSDGNDIVDVSQETVIVPTGSYSAIKFDQETANKQWGYVQIIEAKDAASIIGGTASLSFKARKGDSNSTLETLRAAIISWDSTADTVTSDVVGTWAGAGTDPSLVANWTYENIPSDLTLTTSYQTFSIEGISIDTASTTNVAVFIWCDDTDATVADTAYITDIKLEEGSTATAFDPRCFAQELSLSKRFYQKTFPYETVPAQNAGTTGALADLARSNGRFLFNYYFPTQMRIAPSSTVYNPSASNANARNIDDNTDTTVLINGSFENGIIIRNDATDASDAFNLMKIHATMDSEL